MATVTLHVVTTQEREIKRLERLGKLLEDSFREETRLSSGWIDIFVSLRTPNAEKAENDIVVIGRLNNYSVNLDGSRFKIINFFAAIECKSHRQQNIDWKVENAHIYVKYNGRWVNAANEADSSARAVRDQLFREVKLSPYVNSFVWLYEFKDTIDLPYVLTGGLVSARGIFEKILSTAQTNRSANKDRLFRYGEEDIYQSTGRNPASMDEEKILKYIKRLSSLGVDTMPALTRKRVEAITRSEVSNTEYFKAIGERLVIFTGGPGTGKTQRLLFAAKALVEDDKKILILTYNHVLRCDLLMIIHYSGLESTLDRGAYPKSANLFFVDIFRSIGLRTNEEIASADYFGALEKHSSTKQPKVSYYTDLKDLLSLLKQDRDEYLELILSKTPYLRSYDILMIDESQDWRPEERDILMQIFGEENIVLAHSSEQITRGGIDELRWDRHVRNKPTRRGNKKCLRQCSNLVEFNFALSASLGYELTSVIENSSISGGQIVICIGEYDSSLHSRLYDAHRKAGQTNFDFCFACHGGLGSEKKGFKHSQEFSRKGINLWDACNEENRKYASFNRDLFRMMFYESARGTEAWSFVSLELDTWLEQIVRPRAEREYDNEKRQLNILEQSELEEKDQSIRKQVARWCLIPLTRSINTSVIQISSKDSLYGRKIYEAAAVLGGGFCEIYTSNLPA
jgi:DNA replication protein DnaC